MRSTAARRFRLPALLFTLAPLAVGAATGAPTAGVRDPQRPARLPAIYDGGDHLQPSHAGYAALAEAMPLSLFDTAGGAK